jgi:hypothetical protein
MKRSQSQAQRIRDYFAKHPGKTVPEVAKAMGLKYQIVYMVKRNMDSKKTPKQEWKVVHVSTSDNSIEHAMHVEMHEPASDPVNHPAHYKYGGIETIDFIEAKELGYNLGNVVKYITRSDHKGNRKQDLEKAAWYLQRELSHMS